MSELRNIQEAAHYIKQTLINVPKSSEGQINNIKEIKIQRVISL